MTHVALTHRTTYRYSAPASLGPQLIRLRPAAHTRAPIHAYRLSVTPDDGPLTWAQDPFGNWAARQVAFALAERLEVLVELEVELRPSNPFAFMVDADAATWPFAYPAGLRSDLQPFLAEDGGGDRFDALTARFRDPAPDTVQRLLDLNAAVREAVLYREREEPGTRSAEETLACGEGSCRDMGWLLVQLFRRLGVAARFVSGYAIQLANGAEVTADRADLHAWAEAFLPGAGWIGFDPTSGLLTAEGHLPLAATARLEAAAPVEGPVYGDVTARFDWSLDLRRLPAA